MLSGFSSSPASRFVSFLSSYVRIGRCVGLMFLPAAAAWLVAPTLGSTFLCLAATFFGCAAGLSFNNFFDASEDEKNAHHGSALSEYPEFAPFALPISLGLYSVSLALAYALSRNIAVLGIFAAAVALSAAYSLFRIKRFLVFKNLFVSFYITLLFVFAYFAFGGTVAPDFILTYAVLFVFFAASSMIADARDVESDARDSYRTVATALGMPGLKKAAFASFAAIAIFPFLFASASLVSFRPFFVFFPLLPFLALIFIAVHREEHARADLLKKFAMLSGFSCLFLFLFLEF